MSTCGVASPTWWGDGGRRPSQEKGGWGWRLEENGDWRELLLKDGGGFRRSGRGQAPHPFHTEQRVSVFGAGVRVEVEGTGRADGPH